MSNEQLKQPEQASRPSVSLARDADMTELAKKTGGRLSWRAGDPYIEWGASNGPSHEVSEAKFFSFENLPLISKSQLFLIETALKQNQPLSIIEDKPQGVFEKFRGWLRLS